MQARVTLGSAQWNAFLGEQLLLLCLQSVLERPPLRPRPPTPLMSPEELQQKHVNSSLQPVVDHAANV